MEAGSEGVDALTAFRRGDGAAGQQLLRRSEPWLRVLSQWPMDGRAAVSEVAPIVGDVCREVLREFPRFEGNSEEEWLLWLRGLLLKVMRHHRRLGGGLLPRDEDEERSTEFRIRNLSLRLGELLPVTGQPGLASMGPMVRGRVLAPALERLPPDFRAVLLLRKVDQLSHSEVALRLGRKPGAIRMLAVRAVARLADEFHRRTAAESAA